MIVELVGLPGSGKSFLAPGIAAEHAVSIVRVGRLGQRLLYALVFAILHPRLALRLLAVCRAQSQGALRRIKTHRLISALAKEQKARVIGGGLIDEGIFQILLTLHEVPAPRAALDEILNMLPRNAYRICFVEAERGTRERRMQARGKAPRSELGPVHQALWQDVLEANLVALKAVALGCFDCVTVRNDGI